MRQFYEDQTFEKLKIYILELTLGLKIGLEWGFFFMVRQCNNLCAQTIIISVLEVAQSFVCTT